MNKGKIEIDCRNVTECQASKLPQRKMKMRLLSFNIITMRRAHATIIKTTIFEPK
jgi:hypothetical protein